MGAPKKRTAITGASAVTSSDSLRTNGHFHLGMLVVANSVDTANDSLNVQLQVSPDEDVWATGKDAAGADATITVNDLDPNGNAFVVAHGNPVGFMRANIETFTDAANTDLSVDVYLVAGGWEGPGMRNRST